MDGWMGWMWMEWWEDGRATGKVHSGKSRVKGLGFSPLLALALSFALPPRMGFPAWLAWTSTGTAQNPLTLGT